MKNLIKLPLFTIIYLCAATLTLHGQSIGINNDNSPPDPSAILDVKSSEKGILIPRLTNDEIELIEDPAQGLIVFNIDENDLYFYHDGDWHLAGSTGTFPNIWTSNGSGIFYLNNVGIGKNTTPSKLNIFNDQEATSVDIDNRYQGTTVTRGIDISLAQNLSSQYGIDCSLSPNSDASLPATNFRANMSTVGGIAGKPIVGFEAFVPPSLLGDKYGLKVYAPGPSSWAAYLDGRTYMGESVIVGGDDGLNGGALSINNNSSTAGQYNFQVRNSYASAGTGINNLFTASTFPLSAGFGHRTTVTGGASGKSINGHYIDVSGALGTKRGLWVNSPGANNWAGYFSGRGIFTEKFFVGDIPQSAFGSANINNNMGNLAALYIESSSSLSTADYGFYNNFSSNVDADRNYANYTKVAGGTFTTESFGHYVDMQFASGIKYGYYVNAPGATNWASYFNGRSYISESLLIGTTLGKPGYRISVDGKIACEELLVEMSHDWPDYVFKPNYNLLPLDVLEKSIKNNGHLPGIPSASEIEDEGLKVGDMQKRMMEKIEELTLYIIQLNKENEHLNARLNKLENKSK